MVPTPNASTLTCTSCGQLHAAVLSVCPHCRHRTVAEVRRSSAYAMAPGRANEPTPPSSQTVGSLDAYGARLAALQATGANAASAESKAAVLAGIGVLFAMLAVAATASSWPWAVVVAPGAAVGTWWGVRRRARG